MNIITFDLENENGFFCLFFFLLSSYIYSKKNNNLLCIKDDKWKFSYKNGFDDYFIMDSNIIKYDNNYSKYPVFGHMKEPDILYSLNDYKIYSKLLYNVNQNIIKKYKLPDKYNSIFIRGGDKLLYEAVEHPIYSYISFLLSLQLYTKNLFVHSDDNLIVEDVEKYIKNNNIDLHVFKISDETNNGGAVVMKKLKYGKCQFIKSVDDMDNNEKKEHTVRMLSAIEIMRNSDNVVLSFDSNVSRFIKINFDCNVYSINHANNLNYNIQVKNPAYGF